MPLATPAQTASAPARDKLRNNPNVLVRDRLIKKWIPVLQRKTYAVLSAQTLEAAERVRTNRSGPIPLDAMSRWSEHLYQSRKPAAHALVDEGRKQAEIELATGVHKGVIFIQQPAAEFVHARKYAAVDEWLRRVASKATAANASKLNRIHKEASSYWDAKLGRGLTPAEIAKRIESEGLALNATHARLIANTDTMYSYHAGVRAGYVEQGVTVLEWLTSKDDVVCPFCQVMDGVKVRSEDPFIPAGTTLDVKTEEGAVSLDLPENIDHPPLHPNCACTLLPVLDTTLAGQMPIVESAETLTDTVEPQDVSNLTAAAQLKFQERTFGTAWDTLTEAEVNEIREYNSGVDASYDMNRYLRTGRLPQFSDADTVALYQKGIGLLDSAIEKSELKKPLVVYRGAKSKEWASYFQDKEGIKKLKSINKPIIDKAFSSTTLSQKIAKGFYDEAGDKGVMLKIVVPTKGKALGISGSKLNLLNRSQVEVLLPRKTSLQITDVKIVEGVRTIVARVIL